MGGKKLFLRFRELYDAYIRLQRDRDLAIPLADPEREVWEYQPKAYRQFREAHMKLKRIEDELLLLMSQYEAMDPEEQRKFWRFMKKNYQLRFPKRNRLSGGLFQRDSFYQLHTSFSNLIEVRRQKPEQEVGLEVVQECDDRIEAKIKFTTFECMLHPGSASKVLTLCDYLSKHDARLNFTIFGQPEVALLLNMDSGVDGLENIAAIQDELFSDNQLRCVSLTQKLPTHLEVLPKVAKKYFLKQMRIVPVIRQIESFDIGGRNLSIHIPRTSPDEFHVFYGIDKISGLSRPVIFTLERQIDHELGHLTRFIDFSTKPSLSTGGSHELEELWNIVLSPTSEDAIFTQTPLRISHHGMPLIFDGTSIREHNRQSLGIHERVDHVFIKLLSREGLTGRDIEEALPRLLSSLKRGVSEENIDALERYTALLEVIAERLTTPEDTLFNDPYLLRACRKSIEWVDGNDFRSSFYKNRIKTALMRITMKDREAAYLLSGVLNEGKCKLLEKHLKILWKGVQKEDVRSIRNFTDTFELIIYRLSLSDHRALRKLIKPFIKSNVSLIIENFPSPYKERLSRAIRDFKSSRRRFGRNRLRRLSRSSSEIELETLSGSDLEEISPSSDSETESRELHRK